MSKLVALKDRNGIAIDRIRHFAPAVFADHAHHSRSDKYEMIPTENLLTEFSEAGFSVTEIRCAGSRVADKAGFGKHMIRFRQQGTLPVVGDVFPEIVLVNSHDGSSSYQLSTGWFRLACSNGLCSPVSEHNAISIRHSGDVSDVIDASFRIVNDFETQIPKLEEMKRLTLSQPERKAFAAAAAELKTEDETDKKLLTDGLLRVKRQADFEPDVWTTLNVVQENMMSGGQRLNRVNGRRRTTRAVNGIDENVKLNRALFTLAEQMMLLKAGA